MPRPYDENDERAAQSKSPRDIGSHKLFRMSFNMDMSDADMREVAEDAIKLKNEFEAWEEFRTELDLRKRRNLGFRAAVLALDLNQAAAAMDTTPEKIKMVMDAYAAAEDARIIELQTLWDAGTLPDRDVLGDPSQDLPYDG